MKGHYDLHIHLSDSLDDLRDKIKIAERLGWEGICLTVDFKNTESLRGFCERIDDMKAETKPDLCSGVEITPKSAQELRLNSRKALRYADLIHVKGGDEEVNRAASECLEVDILCHPEKLAERDYMKQKNSGVDHVMAKFMEERFIGIEFNFTEILNSYGMLRSQITARMRQNIILARKYDTPMIIASGAQNKWDLRAPRDLLSVGRILGMTQGEAKKAVSENPAKILQKSRDRKNPNIILKDLEVIEWGSQKPKEKKMYGWY